MTSITSDGYVEFKFFRPNVNVVALVGDFNGWDQHSLEMESTGDGWWTASLQIAAGEYRFRYLADGQWFNDFASYGIERTRKGINSVLMIPEQGAASMDSYQQQRMEKQVA